MSNILCMAVSKIKSNDKLEYNKQLGAEHTYKLYQAMSEIVMHSAKTFIQEDFEIVVFEDEVDNYQQIFHKNFQHVYDEFHGEDGPHNILFLDCDTLVVAPVQVFGQFERFQLFNYTDPKTLSGPDANNRYGLQYEHYFNAGVRYYPDSMPEELWNLGWSYAKDWDYDIWGTEQIIFNAMMYSQDKNYKTWLRPDMNFQAMNMPFNDVDNSVLQQYLKNWNGIPMTDAKILHLHGTRGAANTLALQWELWRRITGEEFEFSTVEIVKDGQNKPVNITFKV
jgi:hypothetical protein